MAKAVAGVMVRAAVAEVIGTEAAAATAGADPTRAVGIAVPNHHHPLIAAAEANHHLLVTTMHQVPWSTLPLVDTEPTICPNPPFHLPLCQR